jgi:outer membrane murein-binding lipoprotein Lpp
MNKISTAPYTLCAAALVAALAVAGCSKSPEVGAERAENAAAPVQTPVVAETAGMAVPLTQDQVGAQYRIAAEPMFAQNGEVVRTVVSVSNTGKVAISSKGKLPVNLAISLVDKDGAFVARDYIRASLPAEGIPAGSSADVITEVPAKDVAGKSLRFGLVQEAVAWYSDFNVAPVDSTLLTGCENQGKSTLCGKDGKPLANADMP